MQEIVKFQPIWDSFKVGEAAVSANSKVTLFKVPRGQFGAELGFASAPGLAKTDYDTNLEIAGQTESNQRMEISAICIGVANSVATYIKSILEDGKAHVKLKVGGQVKFESPAFRLSSGWGVGEANALGGNSVKDIYTLLPYPIEVGPSQKFEVEVTFHNATTALGTTLKTTVFVFLETVIYEQVA